ncbi:Os01g0147600 [Oryza sativa Japonica Group]|uniref:Os01g0147600 protein n=1 Tax=Oryza sativa subsp. japonica TaxID=39947 RepID=A0A0N7KCB9_ORYSJ|nr:Os01g0147600 [Oryza sativa Japonica Group]
MCASFNIKINCKYVQMQRKKRKATVTPGKLQISKIETPHKLQISEVQTPHKLQISEVETPHQLQISEVEIKSKEVQALVLAQDSQRISQENENLRLQLALKTKELEHEENQKLRLQLELKNKDIESLKKQNDELKAEIEYYKKTEGGEEGKGPGGGETEKDSCVEKERPRRSRGEEVSEDDYVQAGGGLERRKRKATVTPQKVQTSKVGIKNKKVQAQYLSDLAKEAERLSQENENLRWELKFKTKDLEHAVQTVEWKN